METPSRRLPEPSQERQRRLRYGPVRFRIEASRSALIAMQRRYPRADGWSTWWTDLTAACRWLRATYEEGYDGPCLLEGEHEDREPVATRLITELLSGLCPRPFPDQSTSRCAR